MFGFLMRCHRAFECKNYIATFGEDQSNKQVQKKAFYTVITRISLNFFSKYEIH